MYDSKKVRDSNFVDTSLFTFRLCFFLNLPKIDVGYSFALRTSVVGGCWISLFLSPVTFGWGKVTASKTSSWF